MGSGQQAELDQGVWRLELMSCPECGVESPKMKRCLSCGYIFQVEEENEENLVKEDEVEVNVLPETKQEEEVPPIMNEEITVLEPVATLVSKKEDGCDPATRDVMENLVKSLSMQLWSVDMLQEGKVNEMQFDRLLADYSTRLKPCLNRRNEMLEEARNVEPLEMELNEARLRLEELEMRKSIRDASDDEYRVKMPSLKWEIEHYEEGLRVKKAKITFLHDLKGVLSDKEISNLQEKAEKCIRMMDMKDRPWEASAETNNKVKDALKDAKECFESFGYILTD